MTEKILQKKPYPMGAHPEGGGVRFSFVSGSASCGVLLYDKTTGKQRRKINFDDADRIGRVYCRTVFDIAPESSTYLFFRTNGPGYFPKGSHSERKEAWRICGQDF